MQLHPIQQPGQSHIITPTGSILNAYNEYLRISNSQQWSFPLFLQMLQTTIKYLFRYYISIILLFYASSVALAILLLHLSGFFLSLRNFQ